VVIRLALALTFFNFVGANAARILFTLFALELGAPAYAVGLIGGLLYLFPLLLSWPIGMLVDRRGSRGLLTFAAVCGAASLALPYFVPTLMALYVAAAMNGLALACYHVTLQNLIGTLSQPEDRARHFSNFSLAGSLTNFVGPLLAGFAIDYAGHAVACLVTASQPVIALVLLLVWGRLFPRGREGPAPGGPGALSALRDPRIVRMLATSGIVQLGQDLFQFYLPIYAYAAGLSASVIGASWRRWRWPRSWCGCFSRAWSSGLRWNNSLPGLSSPARSATRWCRSPAMPSCSARSPSTSASAWASACRSP